MRAHSCAGWFGKIPSAGDFIARGLPRSFVEPWDEWLSSELSQAQRALGAHWPQSYRRAPPSCFVLGEGVVEARVWFGVLLPSFDRVGRDFPLTIAFGSNSQVIAVRPEWWIQLAAAGRRAAAPDGSAALLDEALAGLIRDAGARATARPDSAGLVSIPDQGLSRWWPVEEGRGGREPRVSQGLPRGELFLELLAVCS
jgi:type VI secretion system protein ImpM